MMWQAWEDELLHLDDIRLPCCYVRPALDHAASKQEVHIFCDTSHRAYGSVHRRCIGVRGTGLPDSPVQSCSQPSAFYAIV